MAGSTIARELSGEGTTRTGDKRQDAPEGSHSLGHPATSAKRLRRLHIPPRCLHHRVACRGDQSGKEQQAPTMKLRDELTQLRKAVDDLQVIVKTRMDNLDPA